MPSFRTSQGGEDRSTCAFGGSTMQPDTIAFAPMFTSAEEQILRALATAVGDHAYQQWFSDKTSLTVQDDEITIGVASPFLADWFQKKYRSTVRQAAQSVLGPSVRVRFEVDPDVAGALIQNSGGSNDVDGEQPSTPKPKREPKTKSPTERRRGRRFSDLSDFVKGPCNELALTAAHQICDSADANFNPLLFHGPVGTGKTHLLEGIYRRLRRENRELQVVYLTSEAFANYFTEALRNHTLPSFRQRFRSVDILLVDDVDFFEGKRVIQEEFLHTFKQLVSHGRQVVLTGNKHPRLSTKLSDELKTRFLSGMVCRMEAPDAETRKEIVFKKARRLSGQFSDEALNFVADRFRNNVRELEGALNCLQTYYCMTGKRVRLGTAQQVLADLERDCIRVIRMADVEEAVCNLFGIEAACLKSSKRGRTVSQPRMLAMYLARKHTHAAYSEIGGYFGGRNHSTVISAEKRVDALVTGSATIQVAAQNWRVQDILDTLEQQLRVS
ncbi:Chromosomal replication initiator protein DnaA [Symmachiella macrocystis]|uniref:Chromosomal replication initiator protein DnaA n=1 Tax=Symmachiella macrocystis TaxID=2527985 RepID=A0A5C6B5M1_9PLAN|nr:chromosomal replication initiator protein DnaA [Symmachiella macrocystis]TWU06599.1 Chromosomal replication initiator protein DnaA [Symmachiella macrocystis]